MKSPEPFYEERGVTLYNGDAAEILPAISLPADAGWVIDPPWDASIALAPGVRKIVMCDGWRQQDVFRVHGAPNWIFTWDCISSWYTRGRPLRRAKYAFWYGPLDEYVCDGAMHGGERESAPHLVRNSRGSYLFEPNPRGKHLADVFASPITSLHAGGGHRHEKPGEWIKMLIANCMGRAPLIVDPFAGSGSTVDACRQLGIPVVAIDIDRSCCEHIVSRISQAVISA